MGAISKFAPFVTLNKALTPKKILAGIVRQGKRERLSWGNESKSEAPDAYTVAISPEDWDLYYGTRIEVVQDRLASMAKRKLNTGNLQVLSTLSVTIEQDSNVRFGKCKVTARFSANDIESESDAVAGEKAVGNYACERYAIPLEKNRIRDSFKTAVASLKLDRTELIKQACPDIQQDVHSSEDGWTQHDEVHRMQTPGYVPEAIADMETVRYAETEPVAQADGHPSLLFAHTLSMPKRNEIAYLSSDIHRYVIRHGSTVGSLPDATIHLTEHGNGSDCCLLGTFMSFKQGWCFTNKGADTMVIHGNGESVRLGKNQSCGLDDGDTIQCIGSKLTYTFECKSPGSSYAKPLSFSAMTTARL